jgi:beta-glucanase (GH16 family)
MKTSNIFCLFFTILIGLSTGGCSSSDENQYNPPSTPDIIEGSGNNDVLVWSDEFDGDGAINTQFWNYETGGGGWGNQEVQVYTSSSANIVKENGVLKITALKKPNGTYTSARITTQNKIDFKYARIDIRAKLPSLAGTWPALWMLGDNFSNSSVGWPKCGEIDIMEQFADKTYVQATCHWDNNGSTASYGLPTNLSTPTEFHTYSIDWRQGSIKAYVDDIEYFVMSTNNTMPFDANFFFIFNVAMGGTNGGTIDPNFTSDSMEVDYIRVYQ